MPEPEMVELPRLTVASALDVLTDYHAELERAEADGPYTQELEQLTETLSESLENE